MKKIKEKIAILPRGLEGLLIDGGRHDLHYFVGAGTAEEAWARKFLDPAKVSSYKIRKRVTFNKITTEGVLKKTNIRSCFKRAGIDALMLTSRETPYINAWAKKNDIRTISTGYVLQRSLEDKVFFDGFMSVHGIKKPESAVLSAKKLRSMKELLFKNGMVVQRKDSSGGEGTFFVRSVKDLRTMFRGRSIRDAEQCLVREYIDGVSYGITVFVSPRSIALSALRLQCFYPEEKRTDKIFAGVQWVPTARLGKRVRGRVNECFSRLGRILHEMRFFGFANFDFLVRDNEVYVIECNPRLSAATPQIFLWPGLISGEDVANVFVRDHRNTAYAATPRVRRMPDTSFTGSFMEIALSDKKRNKVFRIKRSCDIGIYRMRGGTGMRIADDLADMRDRRGKIFFMYSEARKDGRYKGKEGIAVALSNEAIFDLEGNMNAFGKEVLGFVRDAYLEKGPLDRITADTTKRQSHNAILSYEKRNNTNA